MKSFVFYKIALRQYVQKKLSNFPQINYLQRVWRHRKDENFVSQVMKINHDPDTIQLKSFGEKNQGGNIYLINIHTEGIGMGGCLRQILYGLFDAEQLGFTPVLGFRRESCLYAEDEPVNGTENPFEYYFKQATHVSLEDAYQSYRVFLFHSIHLYRIERDLGNLNPNMPSGYVVDDVYLEKLARVYRKYICLNEKTAEMVSLDMENLCEGWKKKKILGVHIRGTDYALQWLNHPNMVTADEFVEAIDEALVKYDYEYIFLATDDENRLAVLKGRYGKKLIYYQDVARGERVLNAAVEKNNRSKHHFLSGYEVLRDMYTLADCDSLICGLSQVSILSRIIRLASEQPYRYSKILDKGIYQG